MATTNDQTFLPCARNADSAELYTHLCIYNRSMKSVIDKLDSLIYHFENLGGASIDVYRKIYSQVMQQKYTVRNHLRIYSELLELYTNSISLMPKQSVEFQSKEMNFIQKIAQNIPVVGGVLAKSMPAIGNIAKNIFGEFMHDTPPLKMSDDCNLSLVDIPRNVVSVAVSADDVLPTQEKLLDMDREQMVKMTDVIERAKIPSRIAIVNWPQTATAGTRLYFENVNNLFQTPLVSGTNTFLANNHPLSFFSQYFQYYRGGFRVTIECLPTRFHQGQLYAAFNPSLIGTTLDGVRNCTAVTIDLGVTNRTSMDIPFLTQTDYLQCVQFNVPADPITLLNTMGTFSIFVQNELDSNGTVATNIDINVYLQVLDDFELKVMRPISSANGVQVYNGSWQMDEEVVKNVRNAGPTQHTEKISDEVDFNVGICSNVTTVSTESILMREYLLAYGQSFAVSNNVTDVLYNQTMPGGFFNVNFATSGVVSYHELYRLNFKITIRINPTQFHQGALVLYWSPLNIDMLTGKSYGTITQLPHAILNISNETECSMVIPYSSMTRVLRSQFPDMGNIYVAVWNTLKCPSTAPQTVKFSVWAQAIDVHMAVKRQVGAEVVFQGDEQPSDTSTENTTVQIAYKKETIDRRGFITTKHDNVLTMLRRFTYVNSGQLNTTVAGDLDSFNVLWELPAFCGREHFNILSTYLASSGSNRFNICSSFGVADNVTAFAYPRYEDTVNASVQPSPAGPTFGNANPASAFRGAMLWHPGVHQQKIIEIPYYRPYPMIAHVQERVAYNTGWPNVDISYLWNPPNTIPTHVPLSLIYHSVGDDFMVYFPIVIPQMRIQRVGLKISELEAPKQPQPKRIREDKPLDKFEFQMLSSAKNTALEMANLGATIGTIRNAATSLKDCADVVREGLVSNPPTSVVNAVCEQSNNMLADFLGKWVQITEFLNDCVLAVAGLCRGGAMACCAIASLTIKVGRFVKPYVWDRIKEMSGVRFQGKDRAISSPDWSSVFSSLAPGVVGSALSMVQHEYSEHDARSFRVRYDEAMIGKTTLTDKCVALFQVVIDYIFEGTGYFVNWYAYSHAEITALMTDYNDMNSRGCFDSDRVHNDGNLTKLTEFNVKAMRILRYAPVVPKFPPMYSRLAADIVKTFKGVVPLKDSSRCVPSAAAFVGDSGIGKSFVVGTILPTLLLMKSGLSKTAIQADKEVWARPTGQNVHFFDGYTGQKVMYVDDFLKNVDGKDADDMINLISCTQTPLEMAKIEEKGRLFSSKFILVTSNSRSFNNVHGLLHTQALCNRFGFSWVVETKSLTGKEAVTKFTEAMVNKKVDEVISLVDDYWNFYVNDVIGGHKRGQVTFASILDMLVADYKTRNGIHDTMRKALMSIRLQGNESDSEGSEDSIDELVKLIYESRLDGSYERYKHDFLDDFRALGIVREPHLKTWNDELTPQQIYYLIDPPAYFQGKSDVFSDTLEFSNQDAISEVMELIKQSHQDGDYESLKSTFKGDFELLKVKKKKTIKKWDDDTITPEEMHYLVNPDVSNAAWYGFCFAIGAGLGLAGFAAYKCIKLLVNTFVSSIKSTFQGQAYDTNLRSKVKPNTVILQNDEDKLRKLRRNIRVIRIIDSEFDDKLCSMYCLAFESKFVLVPRHFIDSYRKKRAAQQNVYVEIELISSDGNTLRMEKVSINESVIRNVGGDACDLCLVYLANANINGAGRLSQFVPTRQEFNAMKNKDLEATIIGNVVDDDIPVVTTLRTETVEVANGKYSMIFSTFCDKITAKGDCGRPYYFTNNVTKPLYALHSAIAGSTRSGATPLILEDILEAMATFTKSEIPIKESVNFQCDGVVTKYWNTPIENLGGVKIKGHALSTVVINKSAKQKWNEHSEWPDKYLPSFKGITEDCHAMYTNAQKCIPKYTNVVEPRIHAKCVAFYCSSFPDERDTHILTEFECINGYDSMQRLVMSTSSGILSRWFKDGKYQFFDCVDEQYYFSSKAKEYIIPIFEQSFVQRLTDFDEGIQSGHIRNSPLWVATIKDELRKIDKVKNMKTRIFEQPSLEYTLLIRKYFGAFLNYIKKRPGFVTHSAIGIDYEAMWKSIYEYLASKGKYGFDVDYTNYDGSVSPQAFDFFRLVTDEYYGDRNPARHCLLYILQNSYVLVGHNLMKTELGNKSGNPMTDVFNSITNVYILYVSYLQSRIQSGCEANFDDFHRDVALLTYGDDVIISADDKTLENFNRVSVSNLTTKLGFVATAADKSGNLQKFEKLSELQFLKSKFVPLNWCVLAPKPIEIAIRELQFISKQNRKELRIKRDLFDCAMRFAAHNGNDEVTRLKRQCADIGHIVRFDFEDFMQEIIDKQRVCGVQTPSIF
jgi:hypothetical protein